MCATYFYLAFGSNFEKAGTLHVVRYVNISALIFLQIFDRLSECVG